MAIHSLSNIAPPSWVSDLISLDLPDHEVRHTDCKLDLDIKRYQSEHATLISVTLHHATSLLHDDFLEMTSEAYAALLTLVPKEFNPARFWNYIPDIHAPMNDGLDRYMVFNLGRRDALSKHYGSVAAISNHVPTATGVGHAGTDLVLHCLALREQPEHIENPRQIAAYAYSDDYGPASPSFARATLVDMLDKGARSLIVGGTSSVRGEDTISPNDLHQQFDETRVNLEALLKHAFGQEADLSWLKDVRAYYTKADDKASVQEAMKQAFPNARSIELLQAAICRDTLLIEIEGVAHDPRSKT